MNNKLKKLMAILLIVIVVFPMQILEVLAIQTGDSYYLQRNTKAFYSVQKKMIDDEGDERWVYVTYEIVYYLDEDTNSVQEAMANKQIAYCMNPELPGVGWAQGSVEGYDIDLTKIASDVRIWRICVNGYPYKMPIDLGVETEEDAYLATKMAINCIINKYKLEEVRQYFQAGEEAIDGQELEEIQRRGNKVVDAIYDLVNIAYNRTWQTPANSGCINVEKVGNLKKDSKQGYYSQEYKVTSNIDINNYTIESLKDFPEGTITTDLNTKSKIQFNKGENLKICIPQEKIDKNIEGSIKIKVNCENYPIFYGESQIPGYQNYTVCCSPYGDLSANTNADFVFNNSKVIVNKTDKDTNEPIQGVKFELTSKGNSIQKEATTNKNGVATFDKLFPGEYILKEKETNSSYVLDKKETKVNVDYEGTTTINLTNEKKKGQIKVIKVDKDNNNIKLEGVIFEILDKNKKVIDTITTNSNGEAITKKLPIDQEYIVKEKQTKQEYVLSDEVEVVKLEENQILDLKFENEKKKGQIKVVKIDEEFNEIKIPNVEFEIYNSKKEKVDSIVTDKNGEAISKRLPIDDTYTIKEINTDRKYLLNEEIKTVVLKEDEINEQIITNKHKKGDLVVYKVDKDNEKIGLGSVEFQLFSEEFNKVIQTYVTDVDGKIKIEGLRVGDYKLIETKTNSWYNLSKDTNVEINWNQTTDTKVENELKKGDVKIIKVDKEDNEIKLEGVKFNILDEKGNILETIITDENGEAKTSKYPIRDFENLIIQEIETKPEYKLEEEKQIVKLQDDQTITLTFENEVKKGQIKVIKVDKDNNEIKIPEVEFEVLDEQNNVVDKLVTDELGKAITKKLPINQKYLVKETKTNTIYKLTDETKIVELEEDKITNITFENEKKKGQIEVIKIDKDNNEIKIPEVEFEVLDEQNKIVDKLITDEQGKAITKKLPIDQKYLVKETKTKTIYKLADEIRTVELEEDKITNITFENEKKKGQIEVIKVDKDNNEIKIPEVEFEVLDEQNKIVDKLVTNEKGEAITKKLPIDQKYLVKETKTKTIYKLTDEIRTVELEEDKITNITFENEKKKGQIEVIKVDKDNNEIKIPEVEFEVLDEQNKIVDKLVTNEQGKAITKKLPIGKYYIKESKTTDKYVLNEEQIPVEIEEDKTVTKEITNQKIKGQIKIIKTSQDDNEILGKKAGSPISNVEFEIIDLNSKVVDRVKTDDNGVALSKKLEKGNYIIKEKNPGEGYVLNESDFFVSIEYNDKIVEIKIQNQSQVPKREEKLPRTGY